MTFPTPPVEAMGLSFNGLTANNPNVHVAPPTVPMARFVARAGADVVKVGTWLRVRRKTRNARNAAVLRAHACRDPANVREYSQRPRQFSADLPFDRLRTRDAAGLDVPEPVGRGAKRGVIFGEKEVIMKRSFDEGAIQLSHLLGCRTANSRERRE